MNTLHLLLPRQRTVQKFCAAVAMVAVVVLSIPPQVLAGDGIIPTASDSTALSDTSGVALDTLDTTTSDTTSDTKSTTQDTTEPDAALTEQTVTGVSEGNCVVVINGDLIEFALSDPHCAGAIPPSPPTPPTSPTDDNIPQCVFGSDSATTFNGAASVPVSPIHSAWTAITHGFMWIWGENPISDAVNAKSETFTKKFTITQIPAAGTLDIAADNSYSVSLNGMQIASDSSEQNYTQAGQDSIAIPVGMLVVGENTLTFTVNNFAQSGGTMETNPAGLLYTVTLRNTSCTTPPAPTKPPGIVIVATKVVCDDESMLPNWGQGGHGPITSTTATDYVASHSGCHLASGWNFELGNSSAGDLGDTFTGEGGYQNGYTAFGPTGANGTIQTEVPLSFASPELHLREVLKPGYVPFTHQTSPDNSNSVSAEFYCANDVLNYDNWDFIRNPEDGKTYYCVAFNAPVKPTVPQTSTVTMCKLDDQQHLLSGWTLTLKGAHVGSVAVNPDGTNYSVPAVPAGSYVVTASGAYVYRPGDQTASTSDAAFSLRSSSEGYMGPYAPWIEENTFLSPYTGWLGVMFNNALTNWGHVFHPDHVYALGMTTGTTQNFNFNILDDQYGDNSGFINVDVDQGYVGVTGDNGCVTFNNVPQGSYTAGELNQSGWNNVSGLGPVIVGSTGNTFNVINHHITDGNPQPTTLKVHIYKYLRTGSDEFPIDTQVQDSAAPTTPQFPMVATWNASNLGVATSSGNYVLGNGHGGAAYLYAADTSPMNAPANYETHELTDNEGPVVSSFNLCSPGKYYLVGYRNASSLAAAQSATLTATAPSYYGLTSDQYQIVVNKACPPRDENPGGGEDPETGTLTIVKNTTGGDGEFTFNVTSGESFIDSASIQTVNASGTASMQLEDGSYSISEVESDDWTVDSVSCQSDGTDEPIILQEVGNGEFTIDDGNDVTCTFHNTKDEVVTSTDPETPTNGGGGGGGSSRNRRNGSSSGRVLGNSTTTQPTGQVLGASCGILIPNYLKIDLNNNATEVKDLQTFLNGELSIMLPITGFFGKLTDAAVRAFQLKYNGNVLTPWVGLPESGIATSSDTTGYVYKTTQWKINMIHCPELNLAFPTLP